MADIGPKRVRFWPLVLTFVLIALAVAAWILGKPLWQKWQTQRSIAYAIAQLDPVEEALNAFISRTGFAPNSNLDAGLAEPDSFADDQLASIRIGRSALITVTFQQGIPSIGGQTIVFVPEQREHTDGLRWRCDGGTVDPQWLPEGCKYQPVIVRADDNEPLIRDLGDLDQAASSLPSLGRDPMADRASTAQRIINEQIVATAGARREALQFLVANAQWPTDNSEVGLPPANRAGGTYFRYLKLAGDGSLEMRFNGQIPSLDGHRFWIRPTMPGQWRCDSTLPDDHLPPACDTPLQ